MKYLSGFYIKKLLKAFFDSIYTLIKAYLNTYLFIGIIYLFVKNDIPPMYLRELFSEINFWNVVNGLFIIIALGILLIKSAHLYLVLKGKK